MRTYLKVVNPVVSFAVLLLCLYSALFDDGFKPDGILKGSFGTYFVAKGLFCSSTLFLLGRILLILMANPEDKKDEHAGT